MREIFRLFFCLIWIFVCLIEMDISSSLSPSLSPPQTPTKNGGGPSNGEVQLQVRSHNILDHFCRLSLVITLSTILRPREKKNNHSCHHSHHKFPQMSHQRWRKTWWWRSPRSSRSPTTSTLSSTSSCDRNSTDILWFTFVYIIQFYV